MEHLRIFMAILLSFLVFFVWEMLFVDHSAQRVQQTEQSAPVAETGAGTVPEQRAETSRDTGQAEVARTAAAPLASAQSLRGQEEVGMDARQIVVESPLYRITLDERGGGVRQVALKKFRQHVEADSKAYELLGEEMGKGSLQAGLRSLPTEQMRQTRWVADVQSDRVEVVDAPRQVTLRFVRGDGLAIEKRLTFEPDSYLIDMAVIVHNGTGQAFKDAVTVGLTQPSVKKNARYGFVGPSLLMDGKLEQIAADDIEEQNRLDGKIRWAAIQDRYFLSAIAPVKPVDASVKLGGDEHTVLESTYIAPETIFPAGGAEPFGFKIYFGPKRVDALEKYGLEMERAVDFGMFDFIAKPCLWFMNWIHGFIPNYGVAIILLTLLTKVVLWPLGNKSYKSMNDMRRMQPLMTEIREKYKNDKKKMNEEMMNLYRVYKVNPLGGCLPMLVQLPVFLALYRMLYEAIELRHAPFFGWINDLSAPDRLFSFNVTIPLMEPPYGIPVLTLIMGGTMFLQQKMTPTPGDPTQAKMMMWMPIVFTVIFVNFSSGLVLYWLVNNLASIAQQSYIYRKYT